MDTLFGSAPKASFDTQPTVDPTQKTAHSTRCLRRSAGRHRTLYGRLRPVLLRNSSA
jgi:hypothetical protein